MIKTREVVPIFFVQSDKADYVFFCPVSSSLSLKVQTVTLNVLAASNFPHERYRSNQVFQGSPGFSLFSKKTSMFLFQCPVLMENHSSGALTSRVMVLKKKLFLSQFLLHAEGLELT